MRRYCWMCGCYRPKQRFSRKGFRQCLCRECAKLPLEERNRIRTIRDTKLFLFQSNISRKNIKTLTSLCDSLHEEIRQLANLILEVALVKPHKRKRRAYLARHRPDLLARLVAYGLYDERSEYAEPDFFLEYERCAKPARFEDRSFLEDSEIPF